MTAIPVSLDPLYRRYEPAINSEHAFLCDMQTLQMQGLQGILVTSEPAVSETDRIIKKIDKKTLI